MKNIKLAAIMAACAIAISGCSSSLGNKTVIKVGDQEVSGRELDFYISELMGAGDSFDSYKETAANSVENMLLISEVAKSWGFNLTDEENEQVTSSLIRIRQQMGGKKAFDKKLKEYGASEEFVKEILASSTYEKKVQSAIDTAEPTEEEMKQYFADNYLRAKHVLITTKDMTTGAEKDKEAAKATADEVLAKAEAGEDFDALITQYNEDPGMASNPDGYVFTDGAMVKEFEDKTKELQPGEIGMCETDYGYHIIKKLALDETPEMFDKLFNDNKSSISKASADKAYDDAVKAKAEEYGIEYEINTDAISTLTALFTPEPQE